MILRPVWYIEYILIPSSQKSEPAISERTTPEDYPPIEEAMSMRYGPK